MKERLLEFLGELRRAGLRCSTSEGLDAFDAVAAAGIERERLREALAATLVKDHADRATFDSVFDRYFALPRASRKAKGRRMPAAEGEGRGGPGAGGGRAPAPPPEMPSLATGRPSSDKPGQRGQREKEESRAAQRLARRRALLHVPFREMGPREVEEADDLVRELADRLRSRCSLRLRRARRRRPDMRRIIRRAASRGGVPIELFHRRPRPGKSDLVGLVDLSHSTETAAAFLLALLAPARRFFRAAVLFAYVDDLTEITYEKGHVVPHDALDLNARSDFGRVLQRLTAEHERRLGRNTVVLVLGDARNNRRPPRADLLRRVGRGVKALVWLNPEAVERWDTGDSVVASYARHIDLLLPVFDLSSLAAGLRRVTELAM
jgi:uncharacterized protein with von Willebrand factor type A (vWA) domain